jgi:4-hydroxy-4-methyl-2-oxoglutarate aldolase
MIHYPWRKIYADLREFDTATLYEAAKICGAFSSRLRPLTHGVRLVGRARTVLCPPGDNLVLHQAVASATTGDVLVVQACDESYGMWGEILTEAAIARGVAGLVIEGGVRDVEAIRLLKFPVFFTSTSVRTAKKRAAGLINIPIACAGCLVHPGDVIVGDETSILAFNPSDIGAILESARKRRDFENEVKQGLRSGDTTLQLLQLELADPSVKHEVSGENG